jgi:hypothetical protein
MNPIILGLPMVAIAMMRARQEQEAAARSRPEEQPNMSTYWDVVCVDCMREAVARGDQKAFDQSIHGYGDLNHDEHLAEWLASRKMATAFAILHDAIEEEPDHGSYAEFRLSVRRNCSVHLGWYALHASHRLAARNEYGSTPDLCNQRLGTAITAPGLCILDKNHEGECRGVGPLR